ncbi:MAG: hydroxymethylglutaryl-CoA lyase [Phycisphaeraceae bacterium]|nr:hydroxymethylglutaryl-CoA lyase [Phycisphaeraceae bacterium]
MSVRVRITDVSARDGLQNEPALVPTPDKARLVEAVGRTGVDEVEITSFVSQRWIPQLGDAPELCELLADRKPAGVVYSALVPNERGMASLVQANSHAGMRLIDKASVFTAASETFSKRNTNAGIAETIQRFGPVMRLAREQGLSVRAYVSCAVACPFEGPTPAIALARVLAMLAELEPDEIDLADTIGVATPDDIAHLLEVARDKSSGCDFLAPEGWVLHLHDTFGRASSCIRTAIELGVRSFDGAVGGLGGCPYASTPDRRAPGNIDAQALVNAIREAGGEAHVNDAALTEAATIAAEILARARASERAP